MVCQEKPKKTWTFIYLLFFLFLGKILIIGIKDILNSGTLLKKCKSIFQPVHFMDGVSEKECLEVSEIIFQRKEEEFPVDENFAIFCDL